MTKKFHNGSAKAWMITTICLIVFVAGLAVLSVWLFLNYTDQKDNVDSKIADAKAIVEREQAEIYENKLTKEKNNPFNDFNGPEDYGSLSFKYPKTWSVYVEDEARDGGDYEAYLNPGTVPPVGEKQQFALRVLIESKSYDSVVTKYDSLVSKGSLELSTIKINDVAGTRLEGSFSKDIRGIAIIFKIRDKTLTMRTDAYTFRDYFDQIIQTIKFNQ
jgi:hypothetical protein